MWRLVWKMGFIAKFQLIFVPFSILPLHRCISVLLGKAAAYHLSTFSVSLLVFHRLTFHFWEQTEVAWSEIWRIQRMLVHRMFLFSGNCPTNRALWNVIIRYQFCRQTSVKFDSCGQICHTVFFLCSAVTRMHGSWGSSSSSSYGSSEWVGPDNFGANQSKAQN